MPATRTREPQNQNPRTPCLICKRLLECYYFRRKQWNYTNSRDPPLKSNCYTRPYNKRIEFLWKFNNSRADTPSNTSFRRVCNVTTSHYSSFQCENCNQHPIFRKWWKREHNCSNNPIFLVLGSCAVSDRCYCCNNSTNNNSTNNNSNTIPITGSGSSSLRKVLI